MKEIGAHVTNSPDNARFGLERALDIASEHRMEAMQIFVGPPQRLQVKQFSQLELDSWVSHPYRGKVKPFIHGPYVMNFINERAQATAAVHSTRECLRNAAILKAEGVIIHCGTWGERTLKEGMQLGRESIARILDGSTGTLLIENTASPKKYKGSLAVIAEMLEPFPKDRVGICFDTCHAYAAGYDLNDRHVVVDIWESYGQLIKLIHFNDVAPKVRLGGGLDRHDSIRGGKLAMGLSYVFNMFECPFVIERDDLSDLQVLFDWKNEWQSGQKSLTRKEWERELQGEWPQRD